MPDSLSPEASRAEERARGGQDRRAFFPRFATYALIGGGVSALQFPFYDCSELPLLSFLAGLAAVVLLLSTADVIYRVSTSPRARSSRLAIVAALGVVGLAGAFALGWFARLTHLCG